VAGENRLMRMFIVCTLFKYNYGDKIEEGEMGGADSTHGNDKFIQNFSR
jgi:hypothetical protein